MTLTQLFLEELDRETKRTRSALERVPAGKDDWKPHAKSMSLLQLASLVAIMPSWFVFVIQKDELDINPTGGGQFPQPAHGELLNALAKASADARQSLNNTTDEFLLTTNWRLLASGKEVMKTSRHIVLRDTLNHLAHHRGQLTVYLRLLEVPVPAIYGPSADDARFA